MLDFKQLIANTSNLPQINKKIIYLDQFALSDMMKSINSSFKYKGPNKNIYTEMFYKLEFLVKANIIVCPNSHMHYNESVLAASYKDIRRMYKHLSGGTSFLHASEINRLHFIGSFTKHLTGKGETMLKKELVCKNYNSWTKKIGIDVNGNSELEDAKCLRKNKENTSNCLDPIFKKWKDMKPYSFDKVYMNEATALADFYIEKYNEYLGQFFKECLETNIRSDVFYNDINDEIIILMNEFLGIINEYIGDISLEMQFNKIREYLSTKKVLDVPNHRIACLMWAALSRKVVAGQKKINKASIVNDIKVISSYMPYSDAIFIDRECHQLLRDPGVKENIECETKIFSLSNKKAFISYLDDIKSGISTEHLEIVRKAYGDGWLEPNLEMYNQ